MTVKYIVTTKDGKVCKWSFIENKDDSDYGNGMYIIAESPARDMFLLDCRYKTKYNFRQVCVEYLLAYYGENLDELSEDD